MLSIRGAAALLAHTESLESLADLARELGIRGPAQDVDAPLRDTLGLADGLSDARIAAGPGAVRALLLRMRGGSPARDQLSRIAARLQSRAPQVLWLVVAVDGAGTYVALAAWTGDRRPPRVRSLIADRHRVVDSDAETVCALAAAASGDDLLLHLRWTEVLGRDALTRRFYRELERRIVALAESAPDATPLEDRRVLALLQTSRLLFLAFLETKGWLDGHGAFLGDRFDACMAAGGAFHERVLLPLFFGTLNTPPRRRAPAARKFGRVPFLNGGLFSPAPVERRHRRLRFSDEAFGALLGDLFARYRFTAREDAGTWSEAAIDPEMLGKAFESLMASDERRDSGAFYTPQALVERVTGVALAGALTHDGVDAAHASEIVSRGITPDTLAPAARARLERLTVLDPACGSGAFLVHALERVAGLLRSLGDDRPLSDIRRTVLTRSVFGVDRNPMAVRLCELRLWLAVVIEGEETDPMRVAPLPNLDRNVRVGDSLAGAAFGVSLGVATSATPRLGRLRERYARATGARKAAAARVLDRDERAQAIALVDRQLTSIQHRRRERLIARRTPDLFGQRHATTSRERAESAELRRRVAGLRRERQRLLDGGALPFSFAVHFADVGTRGGFDVVLGNPPWVRLHRIPVDERESLRRRFAVFRGASWADGAEAAHAGHGFASQVDLSALFVERSVTLLATRGMVVLLLPMKLWRSLAGGGVRRLLQERTELLLIEDLSDSPPAFDAAVYPSLVAARGVASEPPADAPLVLSAHRGGGAISWQSMRNALALDHSPGSPWLLIPPQVRGAFDRLTECGISLPGPAVGRPLLGVKCGCNDAFLVELVDVQGGTARVRSADGREGEVERDLLRPVMRGESVVRWRRVPSALRILWTHGADGAPLPSLPPLAGRWLSRWKRRLLERTDARGAHRWWCLFRTEGAVGNAPRVAWADFGRTPRALVLGPGDRTVALNTCYVARCAELTDARAAAAILNSALAAAWLNVLAEPARGGYRRYLAWTMARFPFPRDWDRARTMLAPLAERCEPPGRDAAVPGPELGAAVAAAYGLAERDVAPLLAWATPS